MKEATKTLVMAGVKNCGIGTAVINGILAFFFTLPKVAELANSDMIFSFMGTALGCGIICPFFAGLVIGSMKNVEFGPKESHVIGRFLPDQVVVHALLTGILTLLVIWGVPELVAMALRVHIVLPRMAWVVLVALYSGVAVSFAMYFGLLPKHYAGLK